MHTEQQQGQEQALAQEHQAGGAITDLFFDAEMGSTSRSRQYLTLGFVVY